MAMKKKAMAPQASPRARKIPWTEEPRRLQSMGSLRVRHDWVTSLSLFTVMHWRRKWQPTPEFLRAESQGWRSLVGCHLMGSHRVGHDWSDLAAAAAVKETSIHMWNLGLLVSNWLSVYQELRWFLKTFLISMWMCVCTHVHPHVPALILRMIILVTHMTNNMTS